MRIRNKWDPDAEAILYHADCRKMLHDLPDGEAQLIVTSPPYNIGKSYEKRVLLDEYLDRESEVISTSVEKLAVGGSICWQVGNHVDAGEVFPLDILLYEFFTRRGLHLRNRIIWHFEHGLHCSLRFSGRYETLLWFTKSDDYVFHLDPVRVPAKYPGKLHFKGEKRGQPSGNPLGKNPADVWSLVAEDWEREIWDIPNVKANHPEKTIHPCQYPVELVERCLLAMTNENDWIYDPYCGVGSALIAAAKHNRRAVGCDRDKAYLEICRERIRQFAEGTLKTRPLGKPVHTPSGREKVAQPPEAWDRQGTLV